MLDQPYQTDMSPAVVNNLYKDISQSEINIRKAKELIINLPWPFFIIVFPMENFNVLEVKITSLDSYLIRGMAGLTSKM
jgi:hypothetical protein